MRITADTNVLLRSFLSDDFAQTAAAVDVLDRAELVAIGLQSLCEFAWVLTRSYEVSRSDVAGAIRELIDTRNVAVDRPGAEAGLSALDAGGDFADGVIAHEGHRLGGETFVSFDKKAVRIRQEQGRTALLLD